MEELAGIRFASFSDAEPSDRVSRSLNLRKWELADYNTTYGGGTMLMCRKGAEPPPVVIKPRLKGWHRVYVCLMATAMPSPSISLKLTDDIGASFFCRSYPNTEYMTWSFSEVAEEYYWKCADMTGQEVTVSKLLDRAGGAIALLWLRFEPMTEADVNSYKVEASRRDVRILHAHTDLDWLGYMDAVTEELLAPFVESMAASDAELLSVEFYPLLQDYSFLEKIQEEGAMSMMDSHQVIFSKLVKYQEPIYKYLTSQCHSRGMRVYAALRQSVGVLPPPYDYSTIGHVAFANEHPEFNCVDRDGEPFTALSCAFPEVQDYLVSAFLKMLPYGFDGITLFFHRGVMTAFEKPVLDLCGQLYPGVDARQLPLDDPRLLRVHSDIVTGYVRKLRKALDDFSKRNGIGRLGIAVIGHYSIEDSVLYGIDVARWAEEGLIDEAITSNMRVFEETKRFIGNDNLIDLDKYRAAKYESPISPVRRYHSGDLELMKASVPKWQELARRTGLKMFYELPWECTFPPEYMREYAMEMYKAGAERLSLWDAFHTRVMNRAEWNIVSRLGHRDELKDMPDDRDGYGRTCRILSINGISIASYHPAWRG